MNGPGPYDQNPQQQQQQPLQQPPQGPPPAYDTIFIQSQPEPAYPKQAIPPPYLTCLPPSQPPSQGQTGYDFVQGPSYAFVPPSGFAPPVNSAPFPVAHGNGPPAELAINLSSGDHRTTDVSGHVDRGLAQNATHLCLYDNDVNQIRGLDRFPSLMRLTLRNNDLTSLKGIEQAPLLRWIDAASNNLRDLRGMPRASYALSWLDISDNDLVGLHGLSYAPSLTWLNAFNSDLRTLDGIDGLPSLRWLDASNNDIRSAGPLFQCRMLQEVNLANNDLDDVQSVLNLAGLPHLFHLNLYNNNFSPQDEGTIVQYFRQYSPNCFINFRSGQFGDGNAHQMIDANPPGGSGTPCCNIL